MVFHNLRPKVVRVFGKKIKGTAKSLNKQPTRLKESKSASTEHTSIKTTAGFPRGLIKNTQTKSN